MSNKPTVQQSSEKMEQKIYGRILEGDMSTCLIGDTMIQKSANHMALLKSSYAGLPAGFPED